MGSGLANSLTLAGPKVSRSTIAAAGRIGQGLECQIERGLIVKHILNYQACRPAVKAFFRVRPNNAALKDEIGDALRARPGAG